MTAVPRVHVELVVTSASLTGAQLTTLLGVAPDVEESVGELSAAGRPRGESAWVIRSTLEQSLGADRQLADLLPKAGVALNHLSSAPPSDARCLLRIVQYLAPDAPETLGFVLDSNWVTMLAGVEGCVDVDQYFDVD